MSLLDTLARFDLALEWQVPDDEPPPDPGSAVEPPPAAAPEP
jgi:hypothetical protein